MGSWEMGIELTRRWWSVIGEKGDRRGNGGYEHFSNLVISTRKFLGFRLVFRHNPTLIETRIKPRENRSVWVARLVSSSRQALRGLMSLFVVGTHTSFLLDRNVEVPSAT